jgi:hypothetical protein
MTPPLLASVRIWLADVFFCDSVDQAADAMADATRWDWLPALSGIAVAADHARAAHASAATENVNGSNMSGSAHYSPSHGIMT